MYLRTIHAEKSIPALQAFIKANPLGLLTTATDTPNNTYPFLQTSHIPWVLDIPTSDTTTTSDSDSSPTNLGILRGHIARANPQAKAWLESLKASGTQTAPQELERDVLVLFNGPAHHYVTPKFYTATKPSTGKVVPTWNYSAVQVYGRATIYHDIASSETSEFLDSQIRDLSRQSEVEIMGYERPWEVEDAPGKYVELLKKAILGIRIEIVDLGGKWKMSQEMGVGDQEGVVKGFEGLGTEVGGEMARTVRERCAKEAK